MALEILDYKPFHGRMMDQFPELYPLWEEGLSAKYLGQGPLFGREEYDKLYEGYNASCNIPGTLVAEELIKAYPEAKVILTTRDFDKWSKSMTQSVDRGLKWNSWDWIAPFDPIYGPWWRYHKFTHALRPLLAPKGERQAYKDHYDLVRRLVPKDRLLEYSVSEGWGPLCKFLEKDVPKESFPNVNNTNEFLEGRAKRWWHAVGCMVQYLLPRAIATAMVPAAIWCYKAKFARAPLFIN
ncbi:hypothetical protein DHEL01_v209156 [Diaporthe helianthi]|uniref:NAD dependent epimerase/dehydratase n=1 Tax=Diaporthe helianthi TaxID=158607 RepID=A0A2P5HQB0_DIAHE|nr:hypothetical protein DHEL01_v209156 [Diaporthe helianthi]